MKSKNSIIIVFLIIIFLFLSIFLVFIKKEKVVYLGDSVKVIIKNDEINIKRDNNLFIYEKAKIYFNGSFIDGFIRTVTDEISNYNIREAFSKDGKKLSFNDGLIAYTGDINIKVGKFDRYSLLTNTEINMLKEIAEENNKTGEISNYYRVDFDIDNDKKEESIYSYTITDSKKQSTITVLVKNDENEIIDIQTGNVDYPSIKSSSFFSFIDFDDDEKYEIVLYKSNGDDSLVDYLIYKYENGIINEIK